MFRKIVFDFLAKPGFKGVLEVDYKGQSLTFGKVVDEPLDAAKADMQILDDAFFRRLSLFGSVGFGESYFLKEYETSDLKKLLLWFKQNQDMLPGFGANKRSTLSINWANSILRLLHKLNKNTKSGSKKNIKAHYDVSNDFYELWLDETMTYSSAYFNDGDDLKTAQENKYRKICEKSELKSGDHVLEIGCGWGGFAVFAAKNYGCKLTITTISDEQYDYAKDRVKKQGLEDKITLIKKDYRDLEGQHDKIVSIEMMEALGHEYVSAFIKKCDSLLAPGGSLCVQCITYPDEHFHEYLKRTDYIKKYIFPGGELLSVNMIKQAAANSGIEVVSVEPMGQSYAKTLNQWAKNFQAKKEQIKALGFDENFFRKWMYYFTLCEVGFQTSYINVAQILMKKKYTKGSI